MRDRMSERELDQGVRRILHDLPGLNWYHTYDSRRSNSGFPDLVVIGPAGVMWRELKTATGRTTAAQNQWIDALRRARQDVDVWRPTDLMDGRIARELAALAGLPIAKEAS